MAAKRKTAADVRVSSNFASSLFERLKAQKLKAVLERVFPTKRIESRGAGVVLMNCVYPEHADHDPSMYIYTTANLAICRSCGFRTRSLLELLAVGAGYSYSEALSQIQAYTGTKLVPDKLAKQLESQDVYQTATKLFGAVCNDFLQRVSIYALDGAEVPYGEYVIFPTTLLHAIKPVLDWLFTKRQLDRQYVPYLPYGVLPPLETFKALATAHLDDWVATMTQRHNTLPSAVAKARRDAVYETMLTMYGAVPAEYALAVTFHTGYSATLAGRIRCRRVILSQGTDNAFFNIPGFAENDPIGYLGLLNGSGSSRREKQDDARLIMVESEISALVMMQNLLNSAMPDVVVIASAGSNNDVDLLHAAGFSSVDLLLDHPDPLVGKGEDQIRAKLQTALHVQARVFDQWPALSNNNVAVKDPDDVIQALGWDHFKTYVFDNADHAFVPATAWAADRAIEEAHRIPDSNILARQNIAAEYGRCVRHPSLLSVFVARVAEALQLPPGPLRGAIVQLKDDEQGLISRVVETIKAEFSILYKDDTSKGGALLLFHKQQRRYVSVPVGDGPAIVTVLANIFGEMYTYFCDNIGLPQELDDYSQDVSPTAIRDGQRFIAEYLKIAFQEISKGVLTLSECEVLGPGIHYFPGEVGETKSTIRIHNGDRWFKVVVDHVKETLYPEELLGPVDGDYVFAPQETRWSQNLISLDDLQAANEVTLESVQAAFKRVLDIINHGWRFKHQHEDAMFFTAALFAFSTGDAFDIKLIMRVIGESNSGKSTLLSLLCKGQVPSLSLNDNAAYMTSYTNASLYQTFDRSRLTMVLEEASQDPTVATHKSVQMDNINETLRQIIYEGGISVTRATLSGKSVTYKLHTNVAMTTITEPRDIQEANRSYMIETLREEGRIDPVIAIGRDMTPQEFAATRRTIQLGLLRFFPRLRKEQHDLYQHLSVTRLATYTAHSRFLRNFAPIGAILKLMGFDAIDEIKRMIEAKKERQLSQAANSASRLLVDRIMRAAVVPLAGSRTAMTTPMQCLSAPGGYEHLNGANLGVVVDPNNWLVIFDHVALMSPGGAGHRIQEIARQTPHQVKATVDQHPDIVPSRRYKELNIPGILAQVHSSALEFEISVLDMKKVRKAVEEAARNYSGTPLTANASGPGGVSVGSLGDVKDNI